MQDIKIIGFDLDQTLYVKSSKIDEIIQRYIYTKIAEIKNCSIDHARDLFYTHYPQLSGRKTLIALGIPNAGDIVQESLERADISPFLQPNENVLKLLQNLKEKYGNLSLITGSHNSLVSKKLQMLNIPKEIFDHIISGEISKSDGTAFRQWFTIFKEKESSLEMKHFVYIGDRKSTDVDVPQSLGMQAILVNVKEKDASVNVPQYTDVLSVQEILL